MLAELASDAVIDVAYEWLCHQRRHWSADTDVWDLRFHWPTVKQAIQRSLQTRTRLLQRIPARIVGVGIRPEHIETAAAE